MRSIDWLVAITIWAGALSCGTDAPAGDGPQAASACVENAYEGQGCNLAVSKDGCGALWKEGCYVPSSTTSACVTMGNVERTAHPGATCQSLGYTIQCNDYWVNQKYLDSWPLGYSQACPKTGTPTSSTPDKCGKCGTFGSYGRCCGEPYCAGECIGSECC